MLKAAIFDMYETLATLYASPRYFSDDIAADAGVPVEKFRSVWRGAERDRSTGRLTLEDVLTKILRENGNYSDELLRKLTEKRRRLQTDVFDHLHPGIIPMLKGLHERGVLVGLISNCFSEEAELIRRSELFPMFDAVCLSFEEGIMKPDPDIYRRCAERLNVSLTQCLYVGDGGSNELETARMLGMETGQALWYLMDGTRQPSGRKEEFRGFYNPSDVLTVF